jgi:hypothetical protein
MNDKVDLKEYVDRILSEKDKALEAALAAVKEANNKTEIAAEKRFELLNELRSGVATKDEVRALEKVVEDMKSRQDKNEGKGEGIGKFIGWILAAVAIIGFIITNLRLK